ncbi:MAG: hypothetical protein WA949_12905 [Phormidesmis sp.]
MITSTTGIEAVKATLEVIEGDRVWAKFGHGRFVLLRRIGDEWRYHHTRLEIAKDSGFSEGDRSHSRSIELVSHPLESLLRISHTEDGGVFIIPAAVGADLPLKEAIAQTDHLGCEIDNAGHDEQQLRYERFRQVSGLSYGLQLSSGNKSIHSHILIDEPLAIDEALRLRRLFVLALLGDPAVTRPHQPMRFAGFYRREKGNYQELLSATGDRYSAAQIETGLQKTFADLGWAFPATLSDELWADLQRALKKDISADEKRGEISELLERGEAFYIEQAKARAERQLQFAQKELSGNLDLVEAVQHLEQRLSATEAFNDPAHDWKFSGNNHARGRCQWHPGTTNSAWLSQVDGKWCYHCPTCTDDKPIGAFQYWQYNRGGVGSNPTGKDWAIAATEWLGLHGISAPDRKKVIGKPALKAKGDRPKNSAISEVQKLDKKSQQRENWLKAMARVAGIDASGATRESINRALMAKQLLPAHHTEGTYQPLELAPARERKMYLLDGQKGTRKTSVAIKSLVDVAKAAGLTVLIVVPTRLLSRDASRVLGTVCHLDGTQAETARYLTTCPESLYKFARQQWDVVIFDEVNEDIKRTFDGSLGVNPELCQKMTERILQTASTVVIANDQMYRASVRAVQRMAEVSPQEVETVQRHRAPSEMTISLYLDMVGGDDSEEEHDDEIPAPNDAFYGFIAQIAKRVEAGEKPAIPCGVQEKARMIDRGLRSYFKGKRDEQGRKYKGQVLDGPFTPDKVKSEFASDPDQWLARHQPHWLIWTPCFNSGVSIESDYFDVQFEIVSVFEGANAASQRGERVRAVLGGGKISERHVFISNRGLPALPDPAIFGAGYWRNLAIATVHGRTEPTDRAMAKSIRATAFLDRHRQELIESLDKKPELFEYWAIEAREVYFKLETLKAEWESNEWDITEGIFDKAECDQWRGVMQQAKQSVIESKSRALGKARAVAADGRDLSPYAAVRARKHHLGEQLSHDYDRLKDSKWLEAWVIAPDNSGGLSSQRVNTLIKMSIDEPDLWETVCKLDTMRAIADSTEIENLPSMPIPAKEIAKAKLLIDCPGVVEVITGQITEWSKELPIVSKAATYLRQHAQRLATLSKHAQRILGLQFKDSTPIIKCLSKALQMAGVETEPVGRTNKLWSYGVKTELDCQKKIDKSAEERPADIRDLLRIQTLSELRQQMGTHLKDVIELAASKWQPIAEQFAGMSGGISPDLIPPKWEPIEDDDGWQPIETGDETGLMWKMSYCQDKGEYERTRNALEALSLDFELQCWPRIPLEQQQKICSFYEVA